MSSERDWNDDGATGYARFLAWRGSLESSATTLRGLLAREFAFTQGETSAQVEPGSALAQQLQATLAQLEAELAEAEVERAHAPARRRAVAALASLLGS